MRSGFQTAQLIAHRGASQLAPENTLAAFRLAHELGAEWVEFDVMLSQDGTAVVIHDETLDRTTNGQGPVADKTYAELAVLDAGQWFSDQYRPQKIPTLTEVLHLAATLNLGVNVELKPTPGAEQATVREVLRILEQDWPATAKPPLLSSFSYPTLQAVRAQNETVALGLLLDEWVDDWAQQAAAVQATSVNLANRIVTAERVAAIKATGRLVLVYTVNDRARAQTLYAWGVDGVFSDQADLLKE